MALDAQQRSILKTFLTEAKRKRSGPRKTKALVESGLVEANLRNPSGGDKDSVGSLQERSHYGSVQRRLNPRLAADRFLNEAAQLDTGRGSAGQLAQRVQRSAHPGRYDQRSGQAQALLGGVTARAASTRSTPGVDRSGQRAALISQFLQQNKPDIVQFALGIRGLRDTPGHTVTTQAVGTPSSSGGTTVIDGKHVVSWMAPAIKFARAHGWKGTIQSGVRSRSKQAQLYARYQAGGNIAAKPGQSNHEIENGGAIDVSDPSGFARALKGYTGKKLVQGTAIGDPVHFSSTGH